MQQIAWYGTIAFFTFAAAAYLMKSSYASALAHAGVLFVLVATLANLIALAEQYRKNRLYKYLALSGLLVVVLAITIIVRLLR